MARTYSTVTHAGASNTSRILTQSAYGSATAASATAIYKFIQTEQTGVGDTV